MYFLGIDVGTGGTRTLVIDEGGRVIASATEEHRAFASPQIGWAEQDPSDWWRACAVAVPKALAQGNLRGDQIIFRRDGEEVALLRRSEISLRGEHNLENVLAAASAAFLAGAAPEEIAAGVRTFPGVEHRLEFVAEISGVNFFNDSKATNVDATIKALESFAGGLFVILGGKDKGSDYAPLIPLLRERARLVLLIGAAAEKIGSQLAGAVPLERAGTLERAVTVAASPDA